MAAETTLAACVLNKPSQRTCAVLNSLAQRDGVETMPHYDFLCAALQGHVPILQYWLDRYKEDPSSRSSSRPLSHSTSHPLRPEWLNSIARCGLTESIKFLYTHADILVAGGRESFKDMPYIATSYGLFEIVRCLYEQGMCFTSEMADNAAKRGSLFIVRFLHEHNIRCTYEGADRAAERGFLDVVRYLHEHGIRVTPKGANDTAASGKLDVLQYIAQAHPTCFKSISWGADDAAGSGYLDVLKFLHANGVSCSYKGANNAYDAGDLSIMHFLAKQGILYTRDR